ncbi:27456_t:CDS:2 [Gigaspora margarita]|uniref:27456_t:CDS:1 n=1 Tax=Gigaspora margarita TaxID=4874 RepID=A0ABN7UAY6_GIGMA|nr:27456_t:CDS:2 [Gigaspora margarita]
MSNMPMNSSPNCITTIEAKLEELCPYYSRIDAIYEQSEDELNNLYSRNEKTSLSFILDDINLDESNDNLSNIAGNNDLYDDNFDNNNADNNDLYENNNEDLLAESDELSSNNNKRKYNSEDTSSKRQHLSSSSKNKNAKILQKIFILILNNKVLQLKKIESLLKKK